MKRFPPSRLGATRGRTLRNAAIAIVALALAGLAWRDAATAYWLEVAPGSAPSLLQSGIRFRLAADRLALFRSEEQPVEEIAAIAERSRIALRREPLDPVAMRQIGLARMWLGQDGGEAILRRAELLSRREVGTQVALFNLAAARGDYPAALDHLDITLAQYPRIADDLLPHLLPMLDDPAFLEAARAFQGRPWTSRLMLLGVERSPDPRIVARVFLDENAWAAGAGSAVVPPLVARLAMGGYYAEAQRVAVELGGASPRDLELFSISAETARPATVPLTWRMGEGEAVRAAPDGADGLAVELQPGSMALVADRVTSLPAGEYRFRHQAAQRDRRGDLTIEWRVDCLSPGQAPQLVWRRAADVRGEAARLEWNVKLPPGCMAQHWQMRAAVLDLQTSARFDVRDLRLNAIR